MNATLQHLLRPELLNTVNGLELVARIVVEGFMSGSNRSQSTGAGQEFSQYRNYEPGDDMRQLDWKMFARSERYFIRQSEIETNITVKFMVDASLSMSHTEGSISKFQYSKVLIAALAYLARSQRDTIGLYAVNEASITVVQPRFEEQQFMRFLTALIDIKAAGRWNSTHAIDQLYHHHGKELILFFTDLYDESGDLQQFISRLKTRRNEVIVFHLLGRHEKDMTWDGSFTFEDLETKKRLQVNSSADQAAYTSRVESWISGCRDWTLSKQIGYQPILMDTPPGDVLRHFLTVRKKMIR